MPTQINLEKVPYGYNAQYRTFYMTERYVPFDTEYNMFNPSTGRSMSFKFSHSTGPEFDPKTEWIYESPADGVIDKMKLVITNDPQITAANAKAYLNHKVNFMSW